VFDDLTLDQLKTLRVDLRTAYQKLVLGQATAEIRYGELGEKFHPANPEACEKLLARVDAEIAKREGCLTGAIIPVVG
jgi:hypothetical protein